MGGGVIAPVGEKLLFEHTQFSATRGVGVGVITPTPPPDPPLGWEVKQQYPLYYLCKIYLGRWLARYSLQLFSVCLGIHSCSFICIMSWYLLGPTFHVGLAGAISCVCVWGGGSMAIIIYFLEIFYVFNSSFEQLHK